jgi:hypothetical protein
MSHAAIARLIPRCCERGAPALSPNELAGPPTGIGLRRSPTNQTKEGTMTTTTTVANQKAASGRP